MADKLVDLAPTKVVTAAEVERFKMEKGAEFEFVTALSNLVRVLESKVGPRNRMYMSMVRFLKNNV